MAIFKAETHSVKGETVIIRSADPEDAEPILNLLRSILAEGKFTVILPEELTRSIPEEGEWIEKHKAQATHLILVAEINQEIIGFLDFQNGSISRLAHRGGFGISIAKAHREKGLGTHLLKIFIAWAENHPLLESIQLKVHGNNSRAIHVYEKLGFMKEGQIKNDLKYSDTEYVDTVLMARPV